MDRFTSSNSAGADGVQWVRRLASQMPLVIGHRSGERETRRATDIRIPPSSFPVDALIAC
jgi:hypothetical protein